MCKSDGLALGGRLDERGRPWPARAAESFETQPVHGSFRLAFPRFRASEYSVGALRLRPPLQSGSRALMQKCGNKVANSFRQGVPYKLPGKFPRGVGEFGEPSEVVRRAPSEFQDLRASKSSRKPGNGDSRVGLAAASHGRHDRPRLRGRLGPNWRTPDRSNPRRVLIQKNSSRTSDASLLRRATHPPWPHLVAAARRTTTSAKPGSRHGAPGYYLERRAPSQGRRSRHISVASLARGSAITIRPSWQFSNERRNWRQI